MEVFPTSSAHKDHNYGQYQPTAVVDPNVQIAETADIGPLHDRPNVAIGGGTKLMSHAVVDGHTKLGEDCMVYLTLPSESRHKI